jgi:hypothetical protein
MLFLKETMQFKRCLLIITFLIIFISTNKLQAEEKLAPVAVFNSKNIEGQGFFAILSVVLAILDLHEQGHYSGFKINLNDAYYVDPKRGDNWWNYFFEPINKPHRNAIKLELDRDKIIQLMAYGFQISRERGFKLIQKYIHLKPHIQKRAQKFSKKHFKDNYMLGVHHRGTDKKYEAGIVRYATTLKAIRQVMREKKAQLRQPIKIYVATDEEDFITYLKGFYPRIIYSNFVRSHRHGPPLHGESLSFYANNYQKGREVLLDFLLLSKCHYLIYPDYSCVDRVLIKFNPRMDLKPLSPAPKT